MRGAVLHATRGARRADVRFAGERDEPLEAAAGAAHASEAVREDPAIEVAAEVLFDESRQAAAGRGALARGIEEGLEPLADDGVQKRLLRLAAPVGER